MTTEKAISKATNALLATGAKTATLYLSDREVVRVSRRMFGKPGRKKFDRYAIELVVTVGKPNYEAREFVKRAKKAGEPFPVKRVQLRYPVSKK